MATWADRVDAIRQWQRERNYEETNRNALSQILQGSYTPPTQDQTISTVPPESYKPGIDQLPAQTTIPGRPGGYDMDRVIQALSNSRFAPEAMQMMGNQFQMQNELKKMMFQKQLQVQMMQDAWNQFKGNGLPGQSNGMPLGSTFEWTPQGPKFGMDASKAVDTMGNAAKTYRATGFNPMGGTLPVQTFGPQGQAIPPTSGFTNYGPMSPDQYGEAQKAIMQNRAQQDYEGVQKMQSDLIDKANSSRQALNITSQMRDLMQNFTPGKMNDVKANVSAYAQALGMPKIAEAITGLDPNATSSIQEFGKLTAQLVSQQVKETSNRMLQSEFNVFLKNNPNPTLTPQALSQLLDFMDRASMYNINGLHDFTVYKNKNPNMTAADFADFNNQRILNDVRANKGAVVAKKPVMIPQGAQTATNPQTGQKIFSPDAGNTWFDQATGNRF